MSENLHDIDSIFRDSLDGKEEVPPAHIWNELDRKLDKRKVASMAGKYHVMKWVAAALFLISVGLAMYVYRVNKTAAYADAVKKQSVKPAEPHPTPSGSRLQPKASLPAQDPQSLLPASGPDSHAVVPPAVNAPAGVPATDSPDRNSTSSVSSSDRIPAPNRRTQPTGRAASHATQNRPLYVAKQAQSLVRNRGSRVARHDSEPVAANQGRTGGASPIADPEEANSGVRSREILFAPVGSGLLTRQAANPAGIMPPFAVKKILLDSLDAAASAVVKFSQPHAQGLTATLFYSPNMVSTHVGNDGEWRYSRSPEDDAKQLKAKEKSGSSWSAGALFDYRFNNHWSLGSGLILSSRITEIKPKLIIAPFSPQGEVRYWFNCSSGYSYLNLKAGTQQSGGPGGSMPFSGDTMKALSSTNKLQYVSVPLVLKYHFGEGKIRFYTGFGLQGNFLVKRKIETYLTKGNRYEYAKTSDIQGLRSVYLSGILTAGATYQITPSFGISVMPNAQIGLMSINQHAPVKSYVSFYGVGAGISIKL